MNSKTSALPSLKGGTIKLSTQRINQPWITCKMKCLLRRKKQVLKRARHTRKPEDLTGYKKLQKTTQRECKTAYNSYIRTTLSEDPDPKKLYIFLHQVQKI